jgi:hypothetical protein
MVSNALARYLYYVRQTKPSIHHYSDIGHEVAEKQYIEQIRDSEIRTNTE